MNTITFKQAVEALLDGNAVQSLDRDGDVYDTYESLEELGRKLTSREVDFDWRLREKPDVSFPEAMKALAEGHTVKSESDTYRSLSDLSKMLSYEPTENWTIVRN